MPGPGLAEADPETVEIVEREMSEIADDLLLAIQASGGPLSDVADDSAKLEDRIDAVVLRLAERVCARPRPVVFNRCAIFVAVTVDAAARKVGLVPVLVTMDRLQAGFQAMLQAAERHGRIVATLSVLTEPAVEIGVRVVMAGLTDHRGATQKWARGALQLDGTAKLAAWSETRPVDFRSLERERILVGKKDLLN